MNDNLVKALYAVGGGLVTFVVKEWHDWHKKHRENKKTFSVHVGCDLHPQQRLTIWTFDVRYLTGPDIFDPGAALRFLFKPEYEDTESPHAKPFEDQSISERICCWSSGCWNDGRPWRRGERRIFHCRLKMDGPWDLLETNRTGFATLSLGNNHEQWAEETLDGAVRRWITVIQEYQLTPIADRFPV